VQGVVQRLAGDDEARHDEGEDGRGGVAHREMIAAAPKRAMRRK
jgi:hypothetical protein